MLFYVYLYVILCTQLMKFLVKIGTHYYLQMYYMNSPLNIIVKFSEKS